MAGAYAYLYSDLAVRRILGRRVERLRVLAVGQKFLGGVGEPVRLDDRAAALRTDDPSGANATPIEHPKGRTWDSGSEKPDPRIHTEDMKRVVGYTTHDPVGEHSPSSTDARVEAFLHRVSPGQRIDVSEETVPEPIGLNDICRERIRADRVR